MNTIITLSFHFQQKHIGPKHVQCCTWLHQWHNCQYSTFIKELPKELCSYLDWFFDRDWFLIDEHGYIKEQEIYLDRDIRNWCVEHGVLVDRKVILDQPSIEFLKTSRHRGSISLCLYHNLRQMPGDWSRVKMRTCAHAFGVTRSSLYKGVNSFFKKMERVVFTGIHIGREYWWRRIYGAKRKVKGGHLIDTTRWLVRDHMEILEHGYSQWDNSLKERGLWSRRARDRERLEYEFFNILHEYNKGWRV